jgi:hypothetical protein
LRRSIWKAARPARATFAPRAPAPGETRREGIWLALCLLALAWPAHAVTAGTAGLHPRHARRGRRGPAGCRALSPEAAGDARITQVQIEYGTAALTCAGPAATTATPEFTPGTTVLVDYTWDLKKAGTLPPGARVWWRWRIGDEFGRTLVTETQERTATDARYAWRTATRGPLTLHWYAGDRDFAGALLDSGIAGLARLAQDTGVAVSGTIDLYIYDGSEALSEIILYAPSWAGGVAFPEHNVVLIGIAPDNLEWGQTTVRHELTHVVIGHLTLNCLTALPTWLDEGLAVYAEGALDAASQAQLDRAVRDNRLDSVRALSAAFSAHPERATLAYAESFSLVDFLIVRDGQARMLALLRAFAAGNNPDASLQSIYGFDSDGLDAAWRAALGAPPRPAASPMPAGADRRADLADRRAAQRPRRDAPRDADGRTDQDLRTGLPTVALTPVPSPEPAGLPRAPCPPRPVCWAPACWAWYSCLRAARRSVTKSFLFKPRGPTMHHKLLAALILLALAALACQLTTSLPATPEPSSVPPSTDTPFPSHTRAPAPTAQPPAETPTTAPSVQPTRPTRVPSPTRRAGTPTSEPGTYRNETLASPLSYPDRLDRRRRAGSGRIVAPWRPAQRGHRAAGRRPDLGPRGADPAGIDRELYADRGRRARAGIAPARPSNLPMATPLTPSSPTSRRTPALRVKLVLAARGGRSYAVLAGVEPRSSSTSRSPTSTARSTACTWRNRARTASRAPTRWCWPAANRARSTRRARSAAPAITSA